MRKRRTRNHIIADLSVNHVERHVLRCGFTTERVSHDYGIDLLLYTYNENGDYENGSISIQLKATDNLDVRAATQTAAFSVSRIDLEYWPGENTPCLLIVYDAREDSAYWLYLQAHFAEMPNFDIRSLGATTTLYIPLANIVSEAAIRQFARFKFNILAQTQGVTHRNGNHQIR